MLGPKPAKGDGIVGEQAAERQKPTELFRFGVKWLVRNVMLGLYRKFPDPFRPRGEEWC